MKDLIEHTRFKIKIFLQTFNDVGVQVLKQLPNVLIGLRINKLGAIITQVIILPFVPIKIWSLQAKSGLVKGSVKDAVMTYNCSPLTERAICS